MFPLAALWKFRFTFVIVCVAFSPFYDVGWAVISARSIEDCISVERLNTLNTQISKNINNIEAGKTSRILANSGSSRSHEFFKFRFPPCKTEQLLQGMELQEKEAQKS